MKQAGKEKTTELAKSILDRRRKTIIVSWDTCVFIAWLKNEVRPVGEMDGVYAIAKQIQKGAVALVTSALTRAEIFQGSLSKPEREKLRKFFRRSNVYVLPLDSHVADLVSEIREFYNPTDFELLTPDAIHLATSIHYAVDEFQTFDGSDKTRKPRNKRKSRCGILHIGDKVADKYTIKISKPNAIQLDLLANVVDSITMSGNSTKEIGGPNGESKPVPVEIQRSGSGSFDGPAGAQVDDNQDQGRGAEATQVHAKGKD